MICKKTNLDTALAAVSEGLTPNSYVILAQTVTLHVADGNLYLITEPDDGEVWYSARVGATTEAFPTVSVDGAKFSKAISYCGESVELTATEDTLIIKNEKGTLKLPILVDDAGQPAVHEFFTPTGTQLKVDHLNQIKMLTGTLSKTMDSIAERCIYTDAECSFATDDINISKGDSLINEPILLSTRMISYCTKHSDVQIYDAGAEFFWFVSADSGASARFSKVFQDFIPQFPLENLKQEFANPVKNSVTVDMASFLNSMQFLAIVADSANDYSVTVCQETPEELILKCADSIQKVPCKSIKGEGPWSIEVDCLSANARFAAYDGMVQLDVYESQLACVGPVTTSIGLIS